MPCYFFCGTLFELPETSVHAKTPPEARTGDRCFFMSTNQMIVSYVIKHTTAYKWTAVANMIPRCASSEQQLACCLLVFFCIAWSCTQNHSYAFQFTVCVHSCFLFVLCAYRVCTGICCMGAVGTRYAFLLCVGPLFDGMQLFSLCKYRSCFCGKGWLSSSCVCLIRVVGWVGAWVRFFFFFVLHLYYETNGWFAHYSCLVCWVSLCFFCLVRVTTRPAA